MTGAFKSTTLFIPTDGYKEWIERFGRLFSDELTKGIVVRAWSELPIWLKSPHNELSDAAIDRLQTESRCISEQVLDNLVSRDLRCLYRVIDLHELIAFMWSSLHYDELPLVIFPSSCSSNDERTILLAADTVDICKYSGLQCEASWFATFNAECADIPLACVVTKDESLSERLHKEFAPHIRA